MGPQRSSLARIYKEHVVYCGIDVAKGQLDGALLGKRWQVPNTKAGIRRLIKMLRQRNTCPQVICEASGGYEQDLVELLHQAAVPLTLVQPQRVHQFARASGILAKTDKIDAQVLVRFGQALAPAPQCSSRGPNTLTARTGSTARSSQRPLSRRTKSSCTVARSLAASTQCAADQADPRAHRAHRCAHPGHHCCGPRTQGQSKNAHLL